jgi:hypothetical protein
MVKEFVLDEIDEKTVKNAVLDSILIKSKQLIPPE